MIAAAVASRSAWEQITKIKQEGDFSPQGETLLRFIGDYYKADVGAGFVSKELLLSRIERSLANPKHVALFRGLIDSLPETSPPNVLTEYIGLRRQAVGNKLIAAISSGASEDSIKQYLEEYQSIGPEVFESGSAQDLVLPDTPLEQVLAPMRTANLIKLLPKSLNDRVDGGVLRGHHIGIFARPETGKTLHAINLAAGFLRQRLRVVFVENEDPKEAIIYRMVSRMTGASKKEVLTDPNRYHKEAMAAGYGNFLLAPLAPGTFYDIEKLVKDWRADVVIIDQLPNLYMKDVGNNTERLGALARGARTLAKRMDVLAVSMMQAGDSASDRLVLNMGDCDGSNTGIPAQLDLMIGIGHNDEFRKQGAQMLTLCKNKISGNHDSFTVFTEPATCRVKSND